MTSSRRRWWLVFGACAVTLLAGLLGISRVVLSLEEAESRARIELAHAHLLRAALGRMDAWLSAQVAAEAARPASEYGNAGLRALSPLANYRGRHVRLHLQLDADGTIRSPQVPPQDPAGVAAARALPAEFVAQNRETLAELDALLDFAALRGRVAYAEERLTASAGAPPIPVGELLVGAQAGNEIAQQIEDLGANEEQLRKQQNLELQRAVTNTGPRVAGQIARTGLLVPLWLGDRQELVYLRRVESGEREALQGFLVDWPKLRTDLLDQVADLFPGAELHPAPEEGGELDTLATAPLQLLVSPPPATAGAWNTTHTAIAFTWLVTLLALGAGALTLRASIAYAERRSRFASAVTHELRTPLTTFRMYSEMLADGIVTEPEKRSEYLGTLRDESERLATLVENVLAFSRLERGHAPTRVRRLTLGDLVQELRGPLEQRAAQGGLELVVDVRGPESEALAVDVDAVSRILQNLVDNAAKYGASSEHPHVELAAWLESRQLLVDVRDHGPGVPRAERRAIFAPFRRAAGREEGTIPGVGLGLALSRELARSMRGDLRLLDDDDRGARFRLTLPAEE